DADTGRVTSVEDFHRARYLYQLTHHGQAALRAIAVYEQALGRRGQLQSVALTDIAEQLGSLLILAQAAIPTRRRRICCCSRSPIGSAAWRTTPRRSWPRCAAPSTSKTVTRRHSSPTRTGWWSTSSASSPTLQAAGRRSR